MGDELRGDSLVHLNVRFSTEAELKQTLDFLYEKSKEGIAFTGLVEAMVNEVTIVTAIHNIKSNKGSKTAGVDQMKMQIKIIRAKDAIASQKPRIVRCPYCRHNSIIVFEDTRGHVQTKCKACGRETVFNVLEMRRLRRLQLYYSSLNG